LVAKVRHVDIVSNDPLAGSQQLLARVALNGNPELEIEMADGAKTDQQHIWTYLCSRVAVDPKADPNGFLEALPQSIDATYVAASDVHDAAECPFAATNYIRMG
jgi:hypothetical protein